MSSGLYLKKLAKMVEINSFFVFQGNLVFLNDRASRAEPSFFARYGKPSFLKGMASQAFLPKSSSQNRAELQLGPNTSKW